MDCNNKILTKSLRKCKTTFNNLYWGFLQSHQQELWQELVLRYKNKHDSVLHIVAFLYKIYMYKLKLSNKVKTIKSPESAKSVEPTKPVEPAKPVQPTKPVEPTKSVEPVKPVEPAKPVEPTKPVEPAKSVEPAKPVESAKPVEPAKLVELNKSDELPVKKQKFLGAIRHTPLSNYKEWKKSEMGFKTSDKVETKLFSEWKIQDNFNPKLYNKNVPWFNYISENML